MPWPLLEGAKGKWMTLAFLSIGHLGDPRQAGKFRLEQPVRQRSRLESHKTSEDFSTRSARDPHRRNLSSYLLNIKIRRAGYVHSPIANLDSVLCEGLETSQEVAAYKDRLVLLLADLSQFPRDLNVCTVAVFPAKRVARQLP